MVPFFYTDAAAPIYRGVPRLGSQNAGKPDLARRRPTCQRATPTNQRGSGQNACSSMGADQLLSRY